MALTLALSEEVRVLEPRCSKRGPRPRSHLGACEEGRSWSARQARWVEPTCQPDPQGFGACYGWSGLGHGSAGQGQTGHRARVGSEPAPTLCKATEPRQNGRDGPPCPSRLAVVDSVTQKACMAHALPAGSAVLLGGAACWWTDRAGPVSRIPSLVAPDVVIYVATVLRQLPGGLLS